MNLKRLLNYYVYIRKYRMTLFWIFIFSIILSGSALLHTMLLSVVIDNILVVKDMSALGVIIVFIVAINFIQMLLKYVVGYFSVQITQMVSINLRMKVLNGILHKKMSVLQKESNSELVSTILTDVQLISNFLCTRPIQIVNVFLTIGITFLLIFVLNMKMAVIAMASISVQMIVSYYMSAIAKKNQQEIRTKDSRHLGALRQLIGNVRYIKAYRAEGYNKKGYFCFLRDLYHLGEKTFNISYIYSTSTSFLSFVGSMIIFTVGVIEIIRGNLTIGVLFVYDSLIDNLYNGINGIVSLFYELHKISVSCDRIEHILNLKNEKDGKRLLQNSIVTVNYTEVSFNYQEKKILEDISLELVAGKTYAIIGKSGVGKSTVVSLLARFYDLDSGRIVVNGIDIKDIKISDLRNRVTFVFQEGVIIDGSVKDNICFGIKNYSSERLERVIRMCCIDEMSDKLENGLETYIRQEENNISGGQKQRIFLARALLRESDVYIFDESFSQIDKQLEKKIINSVMSEYSDKLLIFITHNVALIREIEQMNMIVIEDGNKMICGKHQELLNKSRMYRDLVEKEKPNEA